MAARVTCAPWSANIVALRGIAGLQYYFGVDEGKIFGCGPALTERQARSGGGRRCREVEAEISAGYMGGLFINGRSVSHVCSKTGPHPSAHVSRRS